LAGYFLSIEQIVSAFVPWITIRKFDLETKPNLLTQGNISRIYLTTSTACQLQFNSTTFYFLKIIFLICNDNLTVTERTVRFADRFYPRRTSHVFPCTNTKPVTFGTVSRHHFYTIAASTPPKAPDSLIARHF
jgi:hypothetical protein